MSSALYRSVLTEIKNMKLALYWLRPYSTLDKRVAASVYAPYKCMGCDVL